MYHTEKSNRGFTPIFEITTDMIHEAEKMSKMLTLPIGCHTVKVKYAIPISNKDEKYKWVLLKIPPSYQLREDQTYSFNVQGKVLLQVFASNNEVFNFSNCDPFSRFIVSEKGPATLRVVRSMKGIQYVSEKQPVSTKHGIYLHVMTVNVIVINQTTPGIYNASGVNYNPTGSYTLSVTECCGAGGGGASGTYSSPIGGGGGGGGGYSRMVDNSYQPDYLYISYTVGTGGAGATSPSTTGSTGGTSFFNRCVWYLPNTSVWQVHNYGGVGGNANGTGGSGGLATWNWTETASTPPVTSVTSSSVSGGTQPTHSNGYDASNTSVAGYSEFDGGNLVTGAGGGSGGIIYGTSWLNAGNGGGFTDFVHGGYYSGGTGGGLGGGGGGGQSAAAITYNDGATTGYVGPGNGGNSTGGATNGTYGGGGGGGYYNSGGSGGNGANGGNGYVVVTMVA